MKCPLVGGRFLMGLIFFIYLTLTQIGWRGAVLGVFMGYTILFRKPFSLYLRISSSFDVKDEFPSPRN